MIAINIISVMSNIVMSVWVSFLRLIFTFLHLVYSGFQYFDTAWVHFRRKIEAVFTINTTDSDLYVSKFVTSLERCPRHLALIVGNEAVKSEDFTNIVIWSLAAGISFLTVYDYSGILLENESKLYKYIVENAKVIPEHIIFKNLKVKNGVSKNLKNKIIVNFLKGSDGKEAFATLVSLLGSRKVSDLSQDIISEEIDGICKYPDPDVAIITGPVISTYGFPPWKIHLTEILRLRYLENCSAVEFCHLLRRYSMVQQRCGK